MANSKVLVAMSGGVDSSVAAAILKNEGHELMGATMKLYSAKGKEGLKSCCGYGPEQDAKRVAEILGFKHIVLNAEKLFNETVIHDFLSEYKAGRTPNPCVRCNTFLKFDFLVKKAEELGFNAVATGHYARIINGRLLKAIDQAKDQSYFLYTLTPDTINKVMFPIGGLHKNEVRKLAQNLGLPVHDKKESQDICFVPRGKYRDFLENNGVKDIKGLMFNTDGSLAGEHEGLSKYTIGQRKGLGPQGKRSYVTAIDTITNRIIIGDKKDLVAEGVELTDLSSCSLPILAKEKCEVRLRYRSKVIPSVVASLDGTKMRIKFDVPADSVAPGQSAVLYRGDEVMGGGIILRKLDENDFN